MRGRLSTLSNQPSSCSFPVRVSQHAGELLHHLISQVSLWVQGTKPCKSLLFFGRELFSSAQKHPGGLA